MKKLKKKNKLLANLIIVFIIGITLGYIIGVIFGMLIQQTLLVASAVEIAEGLEGTNINIEIDINETIMVDRMIEFFNDTIKQNTTIEET